MHRFIKASAALDAFGETNPEALVGRKLAVPTEDGAVEYRLGEYLFQQDAFVATLMPHLPPTTMTTARNGVRS